MQINLLDAFTPKVGRVREIREEQQVPLIKAKQMAQAEQCRSLMTKLQRRRLNDATPISDKQALNILLEVIDRAAKKCL